MSWETDIFLRGRVKLFNADVESLKRDDAENEKNHHETDEGNRKGKYKHLIVFIIIIISIITIFFLFTFPDSFTWNLNFS